ncbi:metallophosphoesterase family protein [Saezia sanguinis]|uniref:metallophosphoesterase family protein n=1 Tax=Saezia sanguinis TaxID=1965230 RepID=UPI00304A5887
MEASYARVYNFTGSAIHVKANNNHDSDWSGKFDPHTQFDGDQGVSIADGTYHLARLLLRSGGGYSLFITVGSDSKEITFDQKKAHEDDCFYEIGAKVGGMCITVVNNWYKYKGEFKNDENLRPLHPSNESYEDKDTEFRGTLNIYIRPTKKREINAIKFFVLSDVHIQADREDSQSIHSYQIRDAMLRTPDYHTYDFIFLPGDLVNTTSNNYDEMYGYLWPCKEDLPNQPLLCDGFGNHDMIYSGGHSCDIAQLIRDRNTIRKNILKENIEIYDTDPCDSANGLHYMIRTKLRETKVYFFMLNLLPTTGYGYGDDDGQIRERNGSNALTFLKKKLSTIEDKSSPVFLFHHYGFELPDSENPNRYWSLEERQTYLAALQGYKVKGIFYGHAHVTRKDESWKNNEIRNYDPPKNIWIAGGVQGKINGLFLSAVYPVYTINDDNLLVNVHDATSEFVK